MPGCFGNHPEDRYFSRQLDKHLDAQYAHAEKIDKRADDIYRAKLESLPIVYRTTCFGNRIIYLNDVIESIYYGSSDDGIALACAVRDNNPEEAGRLLIKLLTNKMREDARDEAENEA